MKYHVSQDTVAELEQVILSDRPFVAAAVQSNRFISRGSYLLWRLVNPHALESKDLVRSNWIGKKSRKGNHHFFSVLMGPDFQKCFPYFLLSGRKSIYMFDAFPSKHKIIERFLNSFNPEHVFLSSSQAVHMLQALTGKFNFSWIPEAISPELYTQYPYSSKDIDVLALGRKYDAHHDRIVAALEMDRRNYLYEKAKGVIIFPTREEFINGLARTKISICVPSSTTSPDRAGSLETMTIRYLQSMISKCLVLGHAPKEMIGLFGYNPVVEIDMENPVLQIRSLLDHFTDYIPLIEKNFAIVVEEHTWRRRWEKITGILK